MFRTLRFLVFSSFSMSLLAAAALANPYADMAKVQKAFYAVRSFRGTITNPRLKKPEVVEFVAPDRWHIITPVGDQYIVGDTMTIHVNGMSMKVPAKSMTGMLQNFRVLAASEDVKKTYTIKYVGTTNVGGQTLRMYSYSKNSDPTLHMKMYIGNDNLPRRNEVTDSHGTTTLVYSDYNAPITINP